MATLADLFTSIANAIRAKGGTSAAMYPNQMPQAIADIQPQLSLQTKTKSYTPSETAQSEAVTADANYDGLQQVNVAVGAIPSDYIGSDVTQRSGSDLTASGRTVTVPQGYYGAQATKSVQQGTAGTPSASKGAVSNHAVTVMPSVTNSEGYISGGTKTGTGVTVTASELVSGSETKTQNGTYNVENLAELVVNVSGGGGGLTKIGTLSIGTISTSSTQAADTGKSLELAVSAYSGYDMLICVCHTSTHTNGRHVATIRVVNFSATSSVSTKTSTQIATSTQHWKLSSGGTLTMRSGTTPYGVYVNAATLSTSSPQTLTLTIYQRYNSTSTGTINGNYVLDVYGVKIQDYI